MSRLGILCSIAISSQLAGCYGSQASMRFSQAAEDSKSINAPSLWPKPSNPVAPGSEASRNLEVVQKFFLAYSKNDLDGIRAVMHDSVEWHIPGQHPISGTKRGIDEVVGFFKKLQVVGFKAEVMIVAANETYVIDAHRGWSNTTSDNIDLNWVLVYQIHEGKIRRVQNFSGDPHASDKFFQQHYSSTESK